MVRKPQSLERLATGIPGLDSILDGGFFRGGFYSVVGQPGTGKTVLANQLGFACAARGESAIYLTMLVETHGRMLEHVASMSFYDEAVIGKRLTYISGYPALEAKGLEGVLDVLRTCIQQTGARLLILDSVSALQESSNPPLELRIFLRGIAALAALTDCTVITLASSVERPADAVHIAADGVLVLLRDANSMREVRQLELAKLRGSAHLAGRHTFTITSEGLAFYPSTESFLAGRVPPPIDGAAELLAFGIDNFDEMLHGGVRRASTTLLLGTPGSGKTLMGTHFLVRGAQQGEPGLYFGLYETPDRLVDKVEHIGLPIAQHITSGALRTHWLPSVEVTLDQITHTLLAELDRAPVRRLFIDGTRALYRATLHPERFGTALTALTNELRRRGITTVMAHETPLFAPYLDAPSSSGTFENLVLTRFVELRSQLHRLIAVLKVRDNDHDLSVREMTISDQGIRVGGVFEGAEKVLSGLGQTINPFGYR